MEDKCAPRRTRRRPRPSVPRARCGVHPFLILGSISTARGTLAFTGTRSIGQHATRCSNGVAPARFSVGMKASQQMVAKCRTSSSRLQLSAKEEAAPIGFESPSSADEPMNVLVRNPTKFIPQTDTADGTNFGAYGAILGAVLCLALLSCTSLPSAILSAYSTLLVEHPIPTKSLTSGVLCGVSDVIAQARDKTRKEFNFGRLVRFAGKGCVGGIIWSFWYDNLDRFLDMESEVNIYTLSGISGDGGGTAAYKWIHDHTAIATTALSIVIEQFFWCPLVFGTFEIPVSTLLNGGRSFTTVQKEVDAKLGGLLVSNAKVWTLANVIIYNAPVEWRTAISNGVDLLWQSIVSDVAADCGKVEDDICDVAIVEIVGDETDYSFYAEKSRI